MSYNQQVTLFPGEDSNAENWMPDPADPKKSIPKPIREFPPVYYWKLQEQESAARE